MSGHRPRNDPREVHLLTRKGSQKTMETAANVRKCCNKGGLLSLPAKIWCLPSDGKKVRYVCGPTHQRRFKHFQSIDLSRARGGQCCCRLARRSFPGSESRTRNGAQTRLWMTGLQPVRVVLDLHKMRIHRRNRRTSAAQERYAHVHRKFLENEDPSGIANQQIHRIVHCAAARILDGHNAQRGRRTQDAIEYSFDRRTWRQHGVFPEPLSSKDMRECPFWTQIIHRSHTNLLKPQPARCK